MIPVAGIQPFTTIDFPGALSCVVFTQGCPWRCRYCQNADLWPFAAKDETARQMEWQKLCLYLESRKTLLDAVVFSGGEATAHEGLVEAISQVRQMGFRIGLHTAGIYPKRLEKILKNIDWLGFDLKAPLDSRYDKITQIKDSAKNVKESLDLVLRAGIPTQYRCTWHPLLLSEEDLAEMRAYLKKLSPIAELVVQNFRAQGCTDSELISSS